MNLAVTFRKQELSNDQMLLSYENMPSAALEFKESGVGCVAFSLVE